MTERHPDDFYPTPASAVTPLLDEFTRVGFRPLRILCPGSGDGRGVEGAVRAWAGMEAYIEGCEVDAARALASLEVLDNVLLGDYLTDPYEFKPADLIIMNPPFKLATEFITKAIDHDKTGMATVAVLGRLGLLSSQRRYEFWTELTYAPTLRVLSTRPSFSGDGKTDATEYGWYVFNPPTRMGRSIDWYE